MSNRTLRCIHGGGVSIATNQVIFIKSGRVTHLDLCVDCRRWEQDPDFRRICLKEGPWGAQAVEARGRRQKSTGTATRRWVLIDDLFHPAGGVGDSMDDSQPPTGVVGK